MAAFLHRLNEKLDLDKTELLVDTSGYLTALAYHELNERLNNSN